MDYRGMGNRLKVIVVAGTRPQFIKSVPLIRAINDHNDSLGQRKRYIGDSCRVEIPEFWDGRTAKRIIKILSEGEAV